MTYNDLYLALRRRFQAVGIEGSGLEARLLTAAAAGKSQEALLRDLRLSAPAEAESRAWALAERRLAGEPVAYLTGSWGFYGLDFRTGPGVLIPRTDTELLVERALALLEGQREAAVLDLCAGSGCVGCAIAWRHPGVRALLLDRSEAALAVARENVGRLGLSDRVDCAWGDVFTGPGSDAASFDMIVCNPPYVPTGELETLDPSVRDYEPREALDGGASGLEFYPAVLERWADALLNASGWLLFEIGEGQAPAVAAYMAHAGFDGIQMVQDTLGCNRVILGKRRTNYGGKKEGLDGPSACGG